MTDKFFPIKTKTACQLKWAWSTVFLNDGTTSSCHRVGRHSVDIENFHNFHNTPEKIKQRQTMLAGEWPQPLEYMSDNEGCRYCQKIEEAGGLSDRQFHISIPNLSPVELDSDLTAVEVTPTILEVFLSNVCNLSCTYCNDLNSSQIEQENRKFGNFDKHGVVIPVRHIDKNLNKQYIEKFFEWLETNSHHLRRLHLLGGEPLYQKDFYRCVDFFEQHPNKDLEFNIVTNLMLDTNKFENLILKIRSMVARRAFKRFDITVSLDCLGPEQEYARWGLNLDVIEKNINLILQHSWIYFNINSTLTPLTIKRFPDLIKKINEWKQIGRVQHHFQTVFLPEHHNPDMFGPTFWKEDFEKALCLMPQSNWQENMAHQYLTGIHQQIQNSCKDSKLIVQLVTHLDELDRRRGSNWRALFPYIEEEYNYVV